MYEEYEIVIRFILVGNIGHEKPVSCLAFENQDNLFTV